MTLTIRELLCRRGFFPRELPPCFTSESYTESAINAHLSSWGSKQVRWCKADRFSSARKSHGRRILHIVNPLAFAHLANQIQEDWSAILAHLSSSPTNAGSISFSEDSLRAIVVDTTDRSSNVESIADSLHFPVTLDSDISRCYASIYTHVITWSLSGKAAAKTALRNVVLLGSRLDKLAAALNEGQTKGVTVGQDTSRILAEIVLASIDKDLSIRLRNHVEYKSRRFIDDYKIYVDSNVNAQHALSALSQAALSFEMEVNSDKTKIIDPAIEIELPWVTPTRRAIEMALSKSINRMIGGFSEVFRLHQAHQDENLMRFFTEALYSVDFLTLDVNVFCSLLLKIAEVSPNTLDSVIMLLLLCEGFLSGFPTDAISKSFNRMLNLAVDFGKDFECCWLLWGGEILDLNLDQNILFKCLSANSSATRILSRFIASKKSLTGLFTNDQITSDAVNVDFSGSADWLCAYESVRLSLFASKLDESTFTAAFNTTEFSILLRNNVKFFDESMLGADVFPQLEKSHPRFAQAWHRMSQRLEAGQDEGENTDLPEVAQTVFGYGDF